MGKKNRIKNLFESTPIESTHAHSESTSAVPEEQHDEASLSVTGPQDETHQVSDAGEETSLQSPEDSAMMEPVPTDEPLQPASLDASGDQEGVEGRGEMDESPSLKPQDETDADDILGDVRRSLIEADADKEQRDSKWWRRFSRRGKKPEIEEAPAPVEIDLPETIQPGEAAEMSEEHPEAATENDEIDDLIDMLAAESAEAEVGAAIPASEPVVEPEPEIDFEEMKRQAFQPRASDAQAEEITDVRSIALEGGEEVLVEVESKPVNPVEERVSAFENALRPYRRWIYTAMALLGVAMAITAALIIFNVYQQSRPEPVLDPNRPHPTGVSLPGGWSFDLGRGYLTNGRWKPAGPEWLDGTEVCRWVALPWSAQLEAVVRTLNPKDPIELSMSNNDRLVYEVYSIRELTPEEMQKLDSSSPCLLLILTRSDSERRWVVTALP
jgi:hypothetical protein